jgi:trehalose 6-phosphate synthase
MREYSSSPVSIDQATSELHYSGYSNRYLPDFMELKIIFSTLWPLFHYKPEDVVIEDNYWQGYKRANQIFADHVEKIAEDGDTIWVHDYHLMLLPQMIRQNSKTNGKSYKIGFFLHIPFPTSEVYRY